MIILLQEREGAEQEKKEKKPHTPGQQNPPQQFSPLTQKVSPQHVAPLGTQNGVKLDEEEEEAGIQHCTISLSLPISNSPHLPHTYVSRKDKKRLTIRIKTLAAHTKLIGKNPRFTDSNIVVKGCCEGRGGSVGWDERRG